jgi:hypothetical protein
VKEEDRDRHGVKEKGKSSVAKSSPASTPVKPGSATKTSPKSTKVSYCSMQMFCERHVSVLRHVRFVFFIRL